LASPTGVAVLPWSPADWDAAPPLDAPIRQSEANTTSVASRSLAGITLAMPEGGNADLSIPGMPDTPLKSPQHGAVREHTRHQAPRLPGAGRSQRNGRIGISG
jgi:hypothetical protein